VLPGETIQSHIRNLRRIIRQESPRLVYTALFDAHIVGRIAAAGTGVPVLSNLTNVAYDPARYADPNVNAKRLRVLRIVDGWTARHLTSHFHAVSQAVKSSAITSLGVEPEAVTVVYRGRDPQVFGEAGDERRNRARSELGLGAESPVVITVGRQEYQKGQRHLLEAVPLLLEEFPDLEILLVGRQGHASAQLTLLCESLGIEKHVRFLGHRTDIADLLAASDIFAFPSVYEGLGGASLEAMAMELPIVASDIPALREVVENGGNGTLVGPGDSRAIADAIGALLRDRNLRQTYGVRSRAIFDQKFNAAQSIPRTVDLMRRVARDPG
jgi:glycosyltransferase involved in cell wall biosynthesis